jgi:hypothetical protein
MSRFVIEKSLFSIRFLSEQTLLLDRTNGLLYTIGASKAKIYAPHPAGFFLDSRMKSTNRL